MSQVDATALDVDSETGKLKDNSGAQEIVISARTWYLARASAEEEEKTERQDRFQGVGHFVRLRNGRFLHDGLSVSV